jgi:hypothetical protein
MIPPDSAHSWLRDMDDEELKFDLTKLILRIA